MEVFRISKCKYIHDLSGNGAMLYGGRWNSKGYPVIYASGSRSLAALEVLVHLSRNNLTDDFCIACISIPDQIPIKEVMEKAGVKGRAPAAIRCRQQQQALNCTRPAATIHLRHGSPPFFHGYRLPCRSASTAKAAIWNTAFHCPSCSNFWIPVANGSRSSTMASSCRARGMPTLMYVTATNC